MDDIKRKKLAKIYKRKVFQPISENIEICPAMTIEELRQAYSLVSKIFKEKRFIDDSHFLRVRVYEAVPGAMTFIAKYHQEPNDLGKIVGVQSMIPDSIMGLPSEHVFGKEIKEARERTQKEGKARGVSEASNQSIEDKFRNTGIATELMRCCLALALYQDRDVITAVDYEKAINFYEFIAFNLIGEEREYNQVTGDKAALVILKTQGLEKRVERLDREAELGPLIHSYFFAENHYINLISNWFSKTQEIFQNPANLGFFINAGRLRETMPPEKIQKLEKLWEQIPKSQPSVA